MSYWRERRNTPEMETGQLARVLRVIAYVGAAVILMIAMSS